MHPLGYFALAPSGSTDAAILSEVVSRCYGDYLERLGSEQKLALRAVLSYYLFYKLKVSSNYAVSDALLDAIPECTTVSISQILLTLEGIESENALAMLKFLTDQRSYQTTVLGEAAPHSHAGSRHSQKLAVVDRLAALQNQLQKMSRNHQTELDTLQLQMQTDLSAVKRELKSIKTVWLSLYGNGSSNQVETVPGGLE